MASLIDHQQMLEAMAAQRLHQLLHQVQPGKQRAPSCCAWCNIAGHTVTNCVEPSLLETFKEIKMIFTRVLLKTPNHHRSNYYDAAAHFGELLTSVSIYSDTLRAIVSNKHTFGTSYRMGTVTKKNVFDILWTKLRTHVGFELRKGEIWFVDSSIGATIGHFPVVDALQFRNNFPERVKRKNIGRLEYTDTSKKIADHNWTHIHPRCSFPGITAWTGLTPIEIVDDVVQLKPPGPPAYRGIPLLLGNAKTLPETDETCPICLDETIGQHQSVATFGCKHSYCFGCTAQLLGKGTINMHGNCIQKCPMCRNKIESITTYTPANVVLLTIKSI